VRFAGGELDGLEVAATPEQAERLPGMSLSVTPGGRLFDRQRQGPLGDRGARKKASRRQR
jgi:hypothetical protein